MAQILVSIQFSEKIEAQENYLEIAAKFIIWLRLASTWLVFLLRLFPSQINVKLACNI